MPDQMETKYAYENDMHLTSDDNILDCEEGYSLDNYIESGLDNSHQLIMSSEEKVYMKKIKILKETYCTILASNYSLKNRVYHVKKQINYLRRLKRVLCNYLSGLNDKFQEGYLEIDDNDVECIGLDEIIGNVVKDCKIAAALSNRKRKNAHNEISKKKQDDSVSELTNDEADYVKGKLYNSSSTTKIESNMNFHEGQDLIYNNVNVNNIKTEENCEPPEKKMAIDPQNCHNETSDIDSSMDNFNDFLKDEDVE
uniref:KxDL domain-containing protein n=1 Tax=Strongyloides venezuelensis TaxID=75913 RepID=A0A0K0F7H4_STRVS